MCSTDLCDTTNLSIHFIACFRTHEHYWRMKILRTRTGLRWSHRNCGRKPWKYQIYHFPYPSLASLLGLNVSDSMIQRISGRFPDISKRSIAIVGEWLEEVTSFKFLTLRPDKEKEVFVNGFQWNSTTPKLDLGHDQRSDEPRKFTCINLRCEQSSSLSVNYGPQELKICEDYKWSRTHLYGLFFEPVVDKTLLTVTFLNDAKSTRSSCVRLVLPVLVNQEISFGKRCTLFRL